MSPTNNAGVDRLRSMAQACIDGADNLVGTVLAFVYAAMKAGRLTLGAGPNGTGCTNSTTYFEYDGEPTPLVAVRGEDGADKAPLVTVSGGNASLYRAMAVNAVALYRSGTKVGGHDATTPEGAAALATDVLGTTTQADHRDVAKKMRPLVKGDKAPKVGATGKAGTVKGEAHKALNPTPREAGTGTVVTHKAQSTHEVANRLVDWVATTDWEVGDDGIDHLAGTLAAVEAVAADLAALVATRDADALLATVGE